jgi:hypothetical protein
MSGTLQGRQIVLLWAGVLLGPIAWSISLPSMLWLTHPVCLGSGRGLLWGTGAVCALVAIGTCVVASLQLARHGFPHEGASVAAFMLRMAVGASAIFALVILLSMVPIAMLTPCPV